MSTLDPDFSTPRDIGEWLDFNVGLCGCGKPVVALKVLHAVLAKLKERRECCGDKGCWQEKTVELEGLLPGGYDNGWFWWVLYWLGKCGLTEHGGNVGACWLSSQGEDLLRALDRVSEEQIVEDTFR